MAWKNDAEMPDLMRHAWAAGGVERDYLLTPDGRRRWKMVRWHVGALFLYLHRIGRHSNDGLTLTDDLGTARNIIDFIEAPWRRILKETIQRTHERALGNKSGHAALLGKRVCVDAVKRICAAKETGAEGSRFF